MLFEKRAESNLLAPPTVRLYLFQMSRYPSAYNSRDNEDFYQCRQWAGYTYTLYDRLQVCIVIDYAGYAIRRHPRAHEWSLAKMPARRQT